MDFLTAAILFSAAVAGGATNAIAGGGTFFTFPALLAVGIPPVAANASSAVAIWPGHAVAVAAYRADLGKYRRLLVVYSLVALFGGLVGAWLLLSSGDQAFSHLIPWLILFATVLFAFSGKILAWLGQKKRTGRPGLTRHLLTLVAFFLISVYGGYFAAGLGILMISTITVMGVDDLQDANGIKNLLSTLATSVAVVTFLFAHVVRWQETSIMLVGSMIGGYAGGKFAHRLSRPVLRKIVIVVGGVLTAYYLFKQYR